MCRLNILKGEIQIMSIYQLMQLSTSELKNRLKNNLEKVEKRKIITAMAFKTLSTVLFAIILITVLNTLFSSKNSSVSVVIFCLILSIRFVDYGYKVRDSIIGLFIIFVIFGIGPTFFSSLHPILYLIANIISIFTILFLTCDNPYMGNAGLYIFSYIFISGFPVHGHDLTLRIEELFFGWSLCAIIFYLNHKSKYKERGIMDVVKEFRFNSEKYQWEILVSLGISSIIMIIYILKVPRPIWLAFACSSILCAYKDDVKNKMKDRLFGVVLGSILFPIVYSIIPESLKSNLGILSGLLLGLCTQYKYSSLFNCLGALLMASSMFGVVGAPVIRIIDNLIGCLAGVGIYYLYYAIIKSPAGERFFAKLDKILLKMALSIPSMALSDFSWVFKSHLASPSSRDLILPMLNPII